MMRACPNSAEHPMQTKPRCRSLLHALIAGGLLAAAFATLAADKPKEASLGNGKGSGAYLTREQLRSCLLQQGRLAQQDQDMLKEQSGLAAEKAAFERSGAELKEQLAALDRTSPEAVIAYNERSVARDKGIDEYEARVPRFNERVEATKAEREVFGRACDSRRYFEEDEIAIRKGK